MLPVSLFPRQIPVGGTPNCTAVDSQLPRNFLCKSNEYCISVNTGSTAICCDGRVSCEQLQPISCDVQLQNGTLHPTANIFTVYLQDLPTCGSSCCPHGYRCTTVTYQSGPICQMRLDESPVSVSEAFAVTATLTPKPSSISSVSAAGSSIPTQSQTKMTTLISTTTTEASPSGLTAAPSPTSNIQSNTDSSISTTSSTTLLTNRAIVGISTGAAIYLVGCIIASIFVFITLKRKRRQNNLMLQNASLEQYEPQEYQAVSHTPAPSYTPTPSSTSFGENDKIPRSNYCMSELSADVLSRHTHTSELQGDVSWYNSSTRDSRYN